AERAAEPAHDVADLVAAEGVGEDEEVLPPAGVGGRRRPGGRRGRGGVGREAEEREEEEGDDEAPHGRDLRHGWVTGERGPYHRNPGARRQAPGREREKERKGEWERTALRSRGDTKSSWTVMPDSFWHRPAWQGDTGT